MPGLIPWGEGKPCLEGWCKAMPGLTVCCCARAGLVAATGLLTATVQVGVVRFCVTGPGERGLGSGKPLPRPAYCITLGVGEVGSCGWGDLGEVETEGELGGWRAEDNIGETREVFERGKGILIGKAGGDKEQEVAEVGGRGVDMERRDAGRGLLR